MANVKRQNPNPYSLIRWTIERAAAEFGFDNETLSKRLKAASIDPDKDHTFSTSQIVTALYGDLSRERTRNEAAAADLREMKRDEFRGRLLPTTWVRTRFDEISTVIRQQLDHEPISQVARNGIYANLRKAMDRDFAAEG